MKLTLTQKIIVGFVLGLALGEFFYLSLSPEVAHQWAGYVQVVSKVFLRLIKMIVGPLVFCTLVVGIAKLGDFKAVGRIGEFVACAKTYNMNLGKWGRKLF